MEKVILKDFRQVKVITLPISGVTVEAYSSILVGDLSNVPETSDEMEKSIHLISKCIKSWNLYNKEDQQEPDPINLENLKKLPAPDFQYLTKELEEFTKEQKKN